ncbi:hypothetical protein AYO38_04675 [bacterium SCGC AG-212-C10]|nr:hypothetical protein AYO38_04675 [bacterium SCGC AG-212-C10]
MTDEGLVHDQRYCVDVSGDGRFRTAKHLGREVGHVPDSSPACATLSVLSMPTAAPKSPNIAPSLVMKMFEGLTSLCSTPA